MDGTAKLSALSYESCENSSSGGLMCHPGMSSYNQLAFANSPSDLVQRQRNVLAARTCAIARVGIPIQIRPRLFGQIGIVMLRALSAWPVRLR
jgi:hypothetical protein